MHVEDNDASPVQNDRQYSWVILSIYGNHTPDPRYCFVFVRPCCPSCANAMMSACRDSGITMRVLQITSDLMIDSSLNTPLNTCNWGGLNRFPFKMSPFKAANVSS